MRKTRSRCNCGFDFTTEANKNRRVCGDCGIKRVPKSREKHFAVLKLPRAVFIEANDGLDDCWVCRDLGITCGGRRVKDHEHKGDGRPRGILCDYHNRLLGPRYTPELVASFARYLNRPVRFEEAA